MTDLHTAYTAQRGKIARAYITLAGELGTKPNFGQLSEANDMSLADLRVLVADEFDLMEAFAAWLDVELAKNVSVDHTMPKRERVLDVLMERFEIMAPYKDGIETLYGIYKRDMSLALRLNCLANRSMGWVLTLSAQNPRGLLRDGLSQGLVLAYLATLPTWFEDEEEGLSKTMSKLDEELRKGENRLEKVTKVMSFIPGLGRKNHKAAA